MKSLKSAICHTQHYNFAIKAFTDTIKLMDPEKYVFSIHETKTKEVLEKLIADDKTAVFFEYSECCYDLFAVLNKTGVTDFWEYSYLE